MNVEDAILLLDRLCGDTKDKDNITDEVNQVIEFNVSPNPAEQEFEACLDLSLTETENLNNLFQDIN